MSDRLEIFQGEDDQWYWRRVARNGETISQGEAYTRKDDAEVGALRANPDLSEVETLEP